MDPLTKEREQEIRDMLARATPDMWFTDLCIEVNIETVDCAIEMALESVKSLKAQLATAMKAREALDRQNAILGDICNMLLRLGKSPIPSVLTIHHMAEEVGRVQTQLASIATMLPEAQATLDAMKPQTDLQKCHSDS